MKNPRDGRGFVPRADQNDRDRTNDRPIEELFAASRRADLEHGPSFHETLHAARGARRWRPARWAFLAASATTCAGAVLGFALWSGVVRTPRRAALESVDSRAGGGGADVKSAPVGSKAPVLTSSDSSDAASGQVVDPMAPDEKNAEVEAFLRQELADVGKNADARASKDGLVPRSTFSSIGPAPNGDLAARRPYEVTIVGGNLSGAGGNSGAVGAVPGQASASRTVAVKGKTGNVAGLAKASARGNPDFNDPGAVGYSDTLVEDLPVAGRSYQNVLALAPGVQDKNRDGSPNVHEARERDFKSTVDGMSNVDPLAGTFSSNIRGDVIDDVEVAGRGANTEAYGLIRENEFLSARENPLSTFSIDVDTASYSNVRRFLESGTMPPAGAVRIEELINYFPYDDPPPNGDTPFATRVEIAGCPWNANHRLARIALKAEDVSDRKRSASNIVFLIDVSGSMSEPSKLPLVISSLKMLVGELDGRDRIAMVVYAGASGLVLPPTPGSDRATILGALDRLQAGGGTNGGQGLLLAYQTARKGFIRGGVNRVILATDGDFNLGVTDRGELLDMIARESGGGIFLTALGFGMGNFKDDFMETLADKGNGNYAYIDSPREARKVLVDGMGGTLVTVAKDVKIQVEFNPQRVASYRLIGYENRLLAKEDFNDDTKDAGEIGAGHSVTALYELVPAGAAEKTRTVDSLRYQKTAGAQDTDGPASAETLTVKLRYKEPEGKESKLLEVPAVDSGATARAASPDFKFAASVAMFGMVLRNSPHRGAATLEATTTLASEGLGRDPGSYRSDFQRLAGIASRLRAASGRAVEPVAP